MSLEKAIEENTKAVLALTAAFLQGKPAAPAASGKQPEAPKPAASGALDYEKDVKPLVMNLAKAKGRDAVVDVLKNFKVEHANQLKPEQWQDFIKAANAKLKEEAPLA